MGDERQFVALLRGINVAGKNKVPMADLRELAETHGLVEPRTYIQSGNLIFGSSTSPTELQASLRAAVLTRFGFEVPIVVRTGARWRGLTAEIPFPEAVDRLLHFVASAETPADDALERLAAYAKVDERMKVVEDGLWIDFAQGVGRSKLTPKVLDRCVGSPCTARNLRTVLAIGRLLDEVGNT